MMTTQLVLECLSCVVIIEFAAGCCSCQQTAANSMMTTQLRHSNTTRKGKRLRSCGDGMDGVVKPHCTACVLHDYMAFLAAVVVDRSHLHT